MIDETIKYFRANVFFRNFEVKGGGDRTMIYLTLYLGAVRLASDTPWHPLPTRALHLRVTSTTTTTTTTIPGQCLKELERVSSKTEAAKSLHQMAIKPFAIPGDSAWCLGGMCSPPKSMAEGPPHPTHTSRQTYKIYMAGPLLPKAPCIRAPPATPPLPTTTRGIRPDEFPMPRPVVVPSGEGLKAYLKQCREEVGLRVVELLYYADGSKNKW